MISFRPTIHAIRHVVGAAVPDLESVAVERWEICPPENRFISAARFLPRQLDRISAAEFGGVAEVVRDFQGGFEAVQDATFGFRLKHIDFVDGVLYAERAARHLRPRTRWLPAYGVPTEVVDGALYESWVGNRWFGNWLADDCLTYRLAEQFGTPVTTSAGAPQGHVPEYQSLLGLRPRRISRVHFEDLLFFRDLGHNASKKARADQLRERLVPAAPPLHAGVFLRRGTSGMRRVLTNERMIAERLATERGFLVLEPEALSVDEIVRACAGARIVVGVEGSQLAHGLAVMPPSATLFVIQPPKRVVSVLKKVTDRQGQTYAFVIGTGSDAQFSVSWDEVARTLDLVEAG